MGIYFFSENKFLYEGVKNIVKEEYGLAVSLITTDSLMRFCNAGIITSNDVFFISSNDFNITMSMLVMLDHFTSNIIFLPLDKGTRKVASYFTLPLTDKVDIRYIKSSLMESMLTHPNKMWKLTYKESVTLSYRLQGMSIYDINSLFSVSAKTVYSHQRNALAKIGVKTIAHLHRLGDSS